MQTNNKSQLALPLQALKRHPVLIISIILGLILIPVFWLELLAIEGSSKTNNALHTIVLPSDLANESLARAFAGIHDGLSWKTITVKRGDTLTGIFDRLHLTKKQSTQIMSLGKSVSVLMNLKPGQVLRFKIDNNNKLQQLLYPLGEGNFLAISRDKHEFSVHQIQKQLKVQTQIASGIINDSLFTDGEKAGLPDRLIIELSTIFGWDIDFAKDLRPGDRFSVMYKEYFLNGKRVKVGSIVAAEFINRGNNHRAILFTDELGHSDYYTADGRSVKKQFLRTPVKFTRISSKFNLHRLHPILHKIRAHKGVDYAAPQGTPIRAAGAGKIIFRGKNGGYGNVIQIKHNARYTTVYAHMSRFNKKLKIGSHVKQGQVIGYVGATGLATGPHLHYEFHINGKYVNPVKVKLPKATPLAKKNRAKFEALAKQELQQLQINLAPVSL